MAGSASPERATFAQCQCTMSTSASLHALVARKVVLPSISAPATTRAWVGYSANSSARMAASTAVGKMGPQCRTGWAGGYRSCNFWTAHMSNLK
eukprot:scaffold10368_cov24-Tisochrysis_lutea.AAC.1